ncbi:MAG: peptidoglycan DD-metalloendopeptidase family protein [Dehalococcoidia bacterium]
MRDTAGDLPDRIPVSNLFSERLIIFNGLDWKGFEEWIFYSSMLFGSIDKWWGDREKRDRQHEGLDICLYRTGDGDIQYLDAETKIPAMFGGRVVKVTKDFLGESVFISHNVYNLNGSRLHTIYGHIRPYDRIRPGEGISAGGVIGVLAGSGESNRAVPHHLHISVAWIPDTVQSQELDWGLIDEQAGIVLLDPLQVIKSPYTIMSGD